MMRAVTRSLVQQHVPDGCTHINTARSVLSIEGNFVVGLDVALGVDQLDVARGVAEIDDNTRKWMAV